jgi:hypothetical protein
MVDGIRCYEAVTGRRGKRLACLIIGDADRRESSLALEMHGRGGIAARA